MTSSASSSLAAKADRMAATSLNTPLSQLLALANTRNPTVLGLLSQRTPIEHTLAATLAQKASNAYQAQLAGNATVPEPVLFHLAGHAASTVRLAVAENPACPPKALRQLAGDVLGSANTPVSSSKDSILTAIAIHPRCPIDLLASLTYPASSSLKHCSYTRTAMRRMLRLVDEPQVAGSELDLVSAASLYHVAADLLHELVTPPAVYSFTYQELNSIIEVFAPEFSGTLGEFRAFTLNLLTHEPSLRAE